MDRRRDDDRPAHGFRLGGLAAEYCGVSVLSRSDAADYWDGNWLACRIDVSAGAFAGAVGANLRVDELERFLEDVSRLYESLKGEARLVTTEDQLELVLRGDGRGHVACTGRVQDEREPRNALAFTLEIDQTHLSDVRNQLGELLRQFPLRGEAPGG